MLIVLEYLAPFWASSIGLSAQIIKLVLYYIGITFSFQLARAILLSYYLRRHKLSSEYKDSFTIVLSKISSLVAHIIFFVIFLREFGINVSDFLTVMSLFAVALVLIFTEQITKFVNGLVVMFSKDFQVNDFIRVGELEGRIRDISFLHVKLHTLTGDIVYVPNSVLLNKEILNYSKKKTRSVTEKILYPRLSKKAVISKVEKLKEELFASFDEIIQESFYYSLAYETKTSICVSVEFRIQTSSWQREREIQRYIVLTSL